MRACLIAVAASLALAALTAPAPVLADPAPGVTVMYEYNFRPGHRVVTGEDGTAELSAEQAGVYIVYLAEPRGDEMVLHVSAGGSDAQMSLPPESIPGTRQLGFRLAEGETIRVRVETAGE